jgi:gas vesicle protein
MADNDSDFGAFFAGFVIGGLVGAAAALVLAPQSGEETRAQIRQRGIELREQVVDSAEDARKRLDETAVQARLQAEKLAQEARARAEELQQRGKLVLEEQKGRLTAAIDATRHPAPKGDASAPQPPAADTPPAN